MWGRRVTGLHGQVSDNATLKALSKLYITAAKQVDVDDGKKAIIVFVPPPLLKEFRAIHKTLVEELEKKFRCARLRARRPPPAPPPQAPPRARGRA